jgi:hypothetical protein
MKFEEETGPDLVYVTTHDAVMSALQTLNHGLNEIYLSSIFDLSIHSLESLHQNERASNAETDV